MAPTAISSESSQLLALAFDAHRAGKLDEATSLYRQSLPYLKGQQNTALLAAIHNNLGAALRAQNDLQGAEIAFTQAITLMPDYPEAYLNLGVVLMDQHEYERAATSFKRALELRPNIAEAYNNLGAALRRLGRLDEATQTFSHSLSLKPDYLPAKMNLASVYQEQNKPEAAIELLQEIVKESPDCTEAYLNLGTIFHQQEQYEVAAELFQKVQKLKPDCAEAYINAAALLKDQRQLEAAKASAQIGIQLRPDSPEAHLNLGTILHDQGNYPAAEESYRNAITLRPGFFEALSELGSVLILQRNASGLEYLRQALQINPDYAAGHWNLAAALLRLGEYKEGWKELEWRWQWNRFPSEKYSFHQPQWKGEPLYGETILLFAEQGLGDTLQFVRYAPLVAERGGRVILEVQPALKSLLNDLPGVEQVIAHGEPLPAFQWQCPLMSLPLAFDTTADSIPNTVPYVPLPQAQEKTKGPKGKLRVGLVWIGNPAHRGDQLRSIPHQLLASLSEVRGIEFIALQQGLNKEQQKEAESVLPVQWKHFGDFTETAKEICTLDLVISIDTSVAHLAGAMGKPVWILLAHAADWRWLLNRDDSPWYPTARLFRQSRLGDWDEVLKQVRQELKSLIQYS